VPSLYLFEESQNVEDYENIKPDPLRKKSLRNENKRSITNYSEFQGYIYDVIFMFFSTKCIVLDAKWLNLCNNNFALHSGV